MPGLFRKDIEKRCAYCTSGSVINDGKVICSRRGVVDATEHCHHFVYDPLRRVPPRPATMRTDYFTAEDFKL